MREYDTKTARIAGRKVKLFAATDDTYLATVSNGFEARFAGFVKQVLRPSDRAVDVGANIGITSLILSPAVERVLAIEPHPGVYPFLVRTLEANNAGNVRPFNVAIGKSVAQGAMEWGSAYGHLIREADTDRDRPGSLTPVPVRPLDAVLREVEFGRPDFVKIDVEGFEWDVLHGMPQALEANPLVYLEFNAWCQVAFARSNPRDFLDFLRSQFRFVYCLGHKGELTRLANDQAALYFLSQNMTLRGCVDDLVCTNDASRLS